MKTTIDKKMKEKKYSLNYPVHKKDKIDKEKNISKTTNSRDSIVRVSDIETSTGSVSVSYELEDKKTLIAFAKRHTVYRDSQENYDKNFLESHSSSTRIRGSHLRQQAMEENMLVVDTMENTNYKEVKKVVNEKNNDNELTEIVSPVFNNDVSDTSVENDIENKLNKAIAIVNEIKKNDDFLPAIMRKKLVEEEEEENILEEKE